MLRAPKVLKEVLIEETQTNKWKELCFNTGGTPSTLQDIKVIPSAGGHCFKEPNSRFFYWRTNYDVLDLIEHSLDTNLLNNQLRIRFEESPILDGITVHEKEENVILLLPTVSSVHKLIFPHPLCDKSYDVCAMSIFSEINISNIRDPTSFYFFNTTPNLPHSASSILNADNDALFCLALNNGTLLLIQLENQTGLTNSTYLKLDSNIPRLLSGLTEMFRGNRLDDSQIIVSLTMEQEENDIYIFALSRSGQLRTFSFKKASCIGQIPLTPTASVSATGAERNIVRKGRMGRKLILAAYVSLASGPLIFILEQVSFEKELQLCVHSSVSTPADHDLVEMIVECNGELMWCIWRSKITGVTMVSTVAVASGDWEFCVSAASNVLFDEDTNQLMPTLMGPNAYYLNRIFEPGIFSALIITKVLNLIRENDPVQYGLSKLELQSMVYETIEEEIAKEVSDNELNGRDYSELVSRHWNRFYSNCLQYQEDGRQFNGLIWLHSASLLVVIAKRNLSFFRNMDVLEDDLISSNENKELDSYRFLIETIKAIDFTTEQKISFHESQTDVSRLERIVDKVVEQIPGTCDIRQRVDALLKHQNLPSVLRKLCDILYMPETFENAEERSDMFRSNVGNKIVAASAKQIIECRLDISYKFAVLNSLLDKHNVANEFKTDVDNFCRAYSILKFCCQSVVVENPDMVSVIELVLHKTDPLRQNMMLDTIWALCEHLWCLTNSKPLAEFLLVNKQFLLLEHYAHLLKSDCVTWKPTLMQCYLEMNEPLKAFNVIRHEEDIDFLLQIVQMFERYEHSHFVTTIADRAISCARLNHPSLPTLYSILFLHSLKLQDFDKAYISITRNPDDVKRIDCLRQLVITLINARAINKLMEFPYTGMLDQLEDILEQRARSVGMEQSDIYYKFSYAFYVGQNNFRKAARIMFEQGYRAETNDLQKTCYASCLNALSLVNPLHAWILKPKSDVDTESNDDCVDILELPQIYREYELASARCKLENCPPSASPGDVIANLVSAHLYKDALMIADLYKLKLGPVFEALVTACVQIPKEEDPWKWLIANDISDLVVGDANPITVGWRLLEVLLMEYEEPKMTTLHKAVVSRMLYLNIPLPFWIQLSYKKRNAAQLLRLYVNYGALEEAVKLACGILQAALTGKDAENFGIEAPLSADSPSLYIPVKTLDHLLLELRYHKMDNYHQILKDNIDAYIDTAISLTQFKSQFKNDTMCHTAEMRI